MNSGSITHSTLLYCSYKDTQDSPFIHIQNPIRSHTHLIQTNYWQIYTPFLHLFLSLKHADPKTIAIRMNGSGFSSSSLTIQQRHQFLNLFHYQGACAPELYRLSNNELNMLAAIYYDDVYYLWDFYPAFPLEKKFSRQPMNTIKTKVKCIRYLNYSNVITIKTCKIKTCKIRAVLCKYPSSLNDHFESRFIHTFPNSNETRY